MDPVIKKLLVFVNLSFFITQLANSQIIDRVGVSAAIIIDERRDKTVLDDSNFGFDLFISGYKNLNKLMGVRAEVGFRHSYKPELFGKVSHPHIQGAHKTEPYPFNSLVNNLSMIIVSENDKEINPFINLGLSHSFMFSKLPETLPSLEQYNRIGLSSFLGVGLKLKHGIFIMIMINEMLTYNYEPAEQKSRIYSLRIGLF